MADPILAPVEHDPWDPSTWTIPQGSSAPAHLMAGLGNALMQTWKGNVQGLVDPVKSLATLPGDVYTGKESLATPEGQKRVQEAALTMMGGGSAPEGATASSYNLWQPVHEALKAELKNKVTPETLQAKKILGLMKTFPESYKTPEDVLASTHGEMKDLGPAMKVLQEHPLAPESAKFNPLDALEAELKDLLGSFPGEATHLDYLSGLSHPLDRGPSPVKSPEEALYPVNWSDLASTVKRPGETASGPYAETLRRAESLGYNTNLPLFKGLENWEMPTAKSPAEGIWGPEADKVNAWSDPTTKPGERGIFASDTPEVSNWYAGGDNPKASGQNFQMFANPKSTLAVHWPDVAGDLSYSGNVMQRVIEAARAKNAEALVIHGMQDLGGPQTQYVFMKPNVLRSTFAMFDPKKKESANLLHSGGSPLLIPVNHDPFGAQNEQ